MSETWEELVEVDYTYECPTDNYLEGTVTETIDEHYNGPARLVVLIDRETGFPEVVLREWEAYDGRPDRLNCDAVVVDCTEDALLCEVLSDYHNNQLDGLELDDNVASRTRLETRSIPTPEGYREFTYNYPLHPDELWDDSRTSYDFDTGEWTMYKNTNEDMIGPCDMEVVRVHRNQLLVGTDSMTGGDLPQAMQDDAVNFRQKLRDMPEAMEDVDDVFMDSSLPENDI